MRSVALVAETEYGTQQMQVILSTVTCEQQIVVLSVSPIVNDRLQAQRQRDHKTHSHESVGRSRRYSVNLTTGEIDTVSSDKWREDDAIKLRASRGANFSVDEPMVPEHVGQQRPASLVHLRAPTVSRKPIQKVDV